MKAPAGRAGADRRIDQVEADPDRSRSPRPPQPVPPLERHDPIPTDKIAVFELAPVRRLVGTWQGPGSIREMRAKR
jgi:hypothetical protein